MFYLVIDDFHGRKQCLGIFKNYEEAEQCIEQNRCHPDSSKIEIKNGQIEGPFNSMSEVNERLIKNY